jgi:hypothetical protein
MSSDGSAVLDGPQLIAAYPIDFSPPSIMISVPEAAFNDPGCYLLVRLMTTDVLTTKRGASPSVNSPSQLTTLKYLAFSYLLFERLKENPNNMFELIIYDGVAPSKQSPSSHYNYLNDVDPKSSTSSKLISKASVPSHFVSRSKTGAITWPARIYLTVNMTSSKVTRNKTLASFASRSFTLEDDAMLVQDYRSGLFDCSSGDILKNLVSSFFLCHLLMIVRRDMCQGFLSCITNERN